MTTSVSRRFESLKTKKSAVNSCGLIPFIMAGDPDLETTARALEVLDMCGASAIELGIPYSDPLADGPVIQAAATRALKQGITFDAILAMVADVTLRSADRIHFADSATLVAGRNITLQAPELSVGGGADVRVSAPGSVSLGAQKPSGAPPAPPPLNPPDGSLRFNPLRTKRTRTLPTFFGRPGRDVAIWISWATCVVRPRRLKAATPVG